MRTKPLITTAIAATMALTPIMPVLSAHAASNPAQSVEQALANAANKVTGLIKSVADSTNAERTSIELNGKQFSQPYRIVSSGTTYMPIYYVDKLLQSLGFTAQWNGTTHIWTLSNGHSAPKLLLDGKTGNTIIAVNGANVAMHISIIQAKDPASGVVTTFMPIWYVQQILNAMGFGTDKWDGAVNPPTWTLAVTGATTPMAPTTPTTVQPPQAITNTGDNPSPTGVTMAQWQAAVKQAASPPVNVNNAYAASTSTGVVSAAEYSSLATATQWYPDPSDKFYDKSFPVSDLKNGYVIQNNPRVVVSSIDGGSQAGDPYVYVLEYVGHYKDPISGEATVWKQEEVYVKTGQVFGVLPNAGGYPTLQFTKLTPVSGQGFNFGTSQPVNVTWASGAGMYVVPLPNWSPNKN